MVFRFLLHQKQGLKNVWSSVTPVDAVVYLLRYLDCLLSGDGASCKYHISGVPRECFRLHDTPLTDEKRALVQHVRRVLLHGRGQRISIAQLLEFLQLCLPENVLQPFVVTCADTRTNQDSNCSWFVPINNGVEFQSCLDVSSQIREQVQRKYNRSMAPFTPIGQNSRTTSLHYVVQTLIANKQMMSVGLGRLDREQYMRYKQQLVQALLDILFRFAREWTSIRTDPDVVKRFEIGLYL